MLLKNQSNVSGVTPMPTDRIDDASTVTAVSGETVTWFYVTGGAWASATGQAAGTVITGKLAFTGVLNSMNTNLGSYNDTSLSWGASTRLDTLASIPDDVYSKMLSMAPADQSVEVTKYLTTQGEYAIDHRRGQIWGLPKAIVADDAASYDYAAPVTGGSGPSSNMNVNQVGGTATVTGGVNGSLGVGGNVAHDAVDAGNPLKIGGYALSAQRTAVAAADRVDASFNLNGEQVIASHTWATNSNRTEEIDPLSSHYLNESLVDTTNVSATTHYYPGTTGGTMDGYSDQSLTGKFIDADGTLTLTLQVSNDEDSTSADWNGAYFYDDELNATVNTKTVTNGTELFSLSMNNNNFRRYRWVVVASGATNTVILKERKKAL